MPSCAASVSYRPAAQPHLATTAALTPSAAQANGMTMDEVDSMIKEFQV
jgi:hypothetical protein